MRFQSAVVFLSLCAGGLSAPIVNAEGRIEDSLDKRSPQIISQPPVQSQPSVNVNAPQVAPQPFAAPFFPAPHADSKPEVVAINQPTVQPPYPAPYGAAQGLGSRPQSQTVNSPATKGLVPALSELLGGGATSSSTVS